MIVETRDIRLKRLRIRSMRRGIREMDLVMTSFAEMRLDTLNDEKLNLYEQLLDQNDQDLHAWITGQQTAPESFRELLGEILQAFNN